MMLSVNSIDYIPKSIFQARLSNFFNCKEAANLEILPIKQADMFMLFFDNSITFNLYKENKYQKEFIKKCIYGIFLEKDIMYHCDEECSWIEDIENKNIIKAHI